jgi:transaldolase / glucose-6-phosphate isomerase
MRYFFERAGGDGKRFVAVTDPGSPLVDLARERGFREVFENDPEIGGRYSVLSYFGLVPAALAGVNVEGLLHRSMVAEQNCTHFDSSSANSGLWMGIAMGELAAQGRDKATFVVSEPISSFGLWVEQLIAESTGKQGKGILPVAGEPLGAPDVYGDDRVFAYLRDPDNADPDTDAKMEALARAGHPVLTLAVHGAADLGRIFFFAEFATAVVGWALGINPFDQPNVQEAKDNTARMLEEKVGKIEHAADLTPLLRATPPQYVGILAYVTPSDAFDAAVDELRVKIRDRTKATTTFGYGPRYLHSTGQYHKGGPPNGVFLILFAYAAKNLDIPEAGYSFDDLKLAQAMGDAKTLQEHGLETVFIVLEGDSADAVRRLL